MLNDTTVQNASLTRVKACEFSARECKSVPRNCRKTLLRAYGIVYRAFTLTSHFYSNAERLPRWGTTLIGRHLHKGPSSIAFHSKHSRSSIKRVFSTCASVKGLCRWNHCSTVNSMALPRQNNLTPKFNFENSKYRDISCFAIKMRQSVKRGWDRTCYIQKSYRVCL